AGGAGHTVKRAQRLGIERSYTRHAACSAAPGWPRTDAWVSTWRALKSRGYHTRIGTTMLPRVVQTVGTAMLFAAQYPNFFVLSRKAKPEKVAHPKYMETISNWGLTGLVFPTTLSRLLR